MDKLVELAMAKWPNVPNCYGWLGLDARGAWRMRDQRAQQMGLLGDKIGNATLRGFINRNYLADERGCYFFQNGPQRVFVNLEATPYIVHSDPVAGWVLHTGFALTGCDSAWMTPEGKLILESGEFLAQIDDRDMAQAMSQIACHGRPIGEAQMLNWLANPDDSIALCVEGRSVPIRPATLEQLAQSFPFVMTPD